MDCANDYCIYNKGYECVLESLSINALGMCNDCIIVDIGKDLLEQEKEKQLDKIPKR